MRKFAALLLLAAGCAGARPRVPEFSEPPPGPYDGLPRYGTSTGTALGATGFALSVAGAQMLREDSSANKKVGAGVAGAGAALLAATLVDALTHDNRNRFAERLEESGALQRLLDPKRDSPPGLEEWLRMKGGADE